MKKINTLLFFLLLTAVLIACGGEEPTAIPESTVTKAPTAVPAATLAPTDTPEPTSTAVPTLEPTATPAPTNTPIPTATPDPAANFIDFADNEVGIALQYPDDWVAFSESDSGVTIFLFVSTEAFIDGLDQGESGVLFGVSALPDVSAPLSLLLEEAIEEFSIVGDATAVGEATPLVINGQEALQQLIVGSVFDADYTVSYTVVNAHRPFLVLSFIPTDDLESYASMLNAMTNSLQFSAPVSASTVLDDNFTSYTANDFLAFRYPQTWVIEEDIDQNIEIMIVSTQELLDGPEEDSRGAMVQITMESADRYDDLAGNTLAETLDAIIADLIDDNSELVVVRETSETTINGLPAASTAFNLTEDDINGYVTFVLIPYEENIVLAWGVAFGGTEVEYASTLDQILTTITLPNAYAAYRSETAPFTFRYPANWVVEEIDEGLVLQSEADPITNDNISDRAVQFLLWHELDGLLRPVEQVALLVENFSILTSLEEVLEPTALIINGQDAATATYTGEFLETPVVVRYTAFAHAGYAVASIAITPADNANMFAIAQDSVANSVRIVSAEVDFTDPAAVVQAIFDAAAAEDFTILPDLCDPLGENDGDTADICTLTADHPQRELYVEYFANGKIAGEPVIGDGFAEVDFSFGPGNSESETMILILRDGFWYLYSF